MGEAEVESALSAPPPRRDQQIGPDQCFVVMLLFYLFHFFFFFFGFYFGALSVFFFCGVFLCFSVFFFFFCVISWGRGSEFCVHISHPEHLFSIIAPCYGFWASNNLRTSYFIFGLLLVCVIVVDVAIYKWVKRKSRSSKVGGRAEVESALSAPRQRDQQSTNDACQTYTICLTGVIIGTLLVPGRCTTRIFAAKECVATRNSQKAS